MSLLLALLNIVPVSGFSTNVCDRSGILDVINDVQCAYAEICICSGYELASGRVIFTYVGILNMLCYCLISKHLHT